MRPRNAALVSILLVMTFGTRVDARLLILSGELRQAAIAAETPVRDDPPPAPAGRRGFPDPGPDQVAPISDEDAKVLRAELDERFPSWPVPILVVDTTAIALEPPSTNPRSPRSLRGSDLGSNVTLVTGEEALGALRSGSNSAVLIQLTQPEYASGSSQASVRYKITRNTADGARWLTGTATLGLRDGRWTMTNRKESAENDLPLRAGGDVKAPVLVKRVEATPTPEAIRSRISGMVILEVTIDETGHVTDARVLKPLPFGLNTAAIDAVKHWEFSPGTLNGKPVTVLYNVPVQFIAK